MDISEKIKQNMLLKETLLSNTACKSCNGVFFSNQILNQKKYKNVGEIRPTFLHDVDKIIHSMAYTRYIDKTQVYSFERNDHITHRVLHVQLVSKIARTIGRALLLNEDLIEAISLGHDVGHTPFGHKGEFFLDEICQKENIGYFCHNAQSVRILKDIENFDITLQVFDGILAHNGEILLNRYAPKNNKTPNEFLNELSNVFNIKDYSKNISPMTLEGCVVRVSDIIAYIGRDIQDAIIVGSIKESDIPKEITSVLGNSNSKIVDTLVKDIIINSLDKNYLTFSEDVFNALINLKKWNYKNIYNSKEANKNMNELKENFNKLYYYYLSKLENLDNIHNVDKSEKTLYEYINSCSKKYLNTTNIKRLVVDFIAGQTDTFFLSECKRINL